MSHKVSVKEAALLTGKSRETINTATKDGVLSFTLNERNHKVIDIAELERVYPLVKTMSDLEPSGVVRPDSDLTEGRPSDLREQVAVLHERLQSAAKEREFLQSERDTLKTERERERRQFEEQIEILRTSLEKAQDQHGKAMLMLTHFSEETRGPEQQQEMTALKETVLQLKQQNKRIYRELQEQKGRQEQQGRSLWKRLFG